MKCQRNKSWPKLPGNRQTTGLIDRSAASWASCSCSLTKFFHVFYDVPTFTCTWHGSASAGRSRTAAPQFQLLTGPSTEMVLQADSKAPNADQSAKTMCVWVNPIPKMKCPTPGDYPPSPKILRSFFSVRWPFAIKLNTSPIISNNHMISHGCGSIPCALALHIPKPWLVSSIGVGMDSPIPMALGCLNILNSCPPNFSIPIVHRTSQMVKFDQLLSFEMVQFNIWCIHHL